MSRHLRRHGIEYGASVREKEPTLSRPFSGGWVPGPYLRSGSSHRGNRTPATGSTRTLGPALRPLCCGALAKSYPWYSRKMLKLATNLRAPRKLSEEDLKRVSELGQKAAKLVGEQTAKMEQLTAEDLAVVVGGPNCVCHKHR